MFGTPLRCIVTWTNARNESQSLTSAPTNPVVRPPDQPGRISFSTNDPVVGQPITATLTDPDGGVTNLLWQWQHEQSGPGIPTEWINIEGNEATYTPNIFDRPFPLRAIASYTDANGSGKRATSDPTNPVSS